MQAYEYCETCIDQSVTLLACSSMGPHPISYNHKSQIILTEQLEKAKYDKSYNKLAAVME